MDKINEVTVLSLFYDEMRAKGLTRDQVFLSLDEQTVISLSEKFSEPLDLPTLEKLADICIANEWLERTTADPNYKYLSLTEAGLQVAMTNEYLQAKP